MFTVVFWKATLERTVATFAASFVGLVLVDDPSGYASIDWLWVTKTALIITGLTLLKAVSSGATNGTPGFGKAERLAPPAS